MPERRAEHQGMSGHGCGMRGRGGRRSGPFEGGVGMDHRRRRGHGSPEHHGGPPGDFGRGGGPGGPGGRGEGRW